MVHRMQFQEFNKNFLNEFTFIFSQVFSLFFSFLIKLLSIFYSLSSAFVLNRCRIQIEIDTLDFALGTNFVNRTSDQRFYSTVIDRNENVAHCVSFHINKVLPMGIYFEKKRIKTNQSMMMERLDHDHVSLRLHFSLEKTTPRTKEANRRARAQHNKSIDVICEIGHNSTLSGLDVIWGDLRLFNLMLLEEIVYHVPLTDVQFYG